MLPVIGNPTGIVLNGKIRPSHLPVQDERLLVDVLDPHRVKLLCDREFGLERTSSFRLIRCNKCLSRNLGPAAVSTSTGQDGKTSCRWSMRSSRNIAGGATESPCLTGGGSRRASGTRREFAGHLALRNHPARRPQTPAGPVTRRP